MLVLWVYKLFYLLDLFWGFELLKYGFELQAAALLKDYLVRKMSAS